MYYLCGLINFNDCISIFDIFIDQDNIECDFKVMCDVFDLFKLLVECFLDSKYILDVIVCMKYLVNVMFQYDVYVVNYYFCCGVYVLVVNCV